MMVIPCSVALASAFIFFLSGVVASLVYEVIERRNWRKEVTRPNIEVFILRLFMCLIVGVISCAWVCSHKTLSTWSRILTCCCGLWSGAAKKPPTPEFPKVSYHHPGSTGSSSDAVTLGEVGSLSHRQGGIGGYLPEGAPLLPHDNRRIVIGSQDTSRIVI